MKQYLLYILINFFVIVYPYHVHSSQINAVKAISKSEFPCIDLSTGDSLKNDSLKTVKLKEVVVKSKQKIHGLEKEIYIPTMSQKQISADGYDLLRNMAIPQLDINVLANSVQVHGKAVTFVVDGHIVTNPDDLKQILPRDILRVEYNEMPTGEYAKYDCIVFYYKTKG